MDELPKKYTPEPFWEMFIPAAWSLVFLFIAMGLVKLVRFMGWVG